jgi:hypothetical protein
METMESQEEQPRNQETKIIEPAKEQIQPEVLSETVETSQHQETETQKAVPVISEDETRSNFGPWMLAKRNTRKKSKETAKETVKPFFNDDLNKKHIKQKMPTKKEAVTNSNGVRFNVLAIENIVEKIKEKNYVTVDETKLPNLATRVRNKQGGKNPQKNTKGRGINNHSSTSMKKIMPSKPPSPASKVGGVSKPSQTSSIKRQKEESLMLEQMHILEQQRGDMTKTFLQLNNPLATAVFEPDIETLAWVKKIQNLPGGIETRKGNTSIVTPTLEMQENLKYVDVNMQVENIGSEIPKETNSSQ